MSAWEDVRVHNRAPLEVVVTLESENNFYAGITDNISEGGVFIATHDPPPVGTSVDMRLKLPDCEEEFDVSGTVCWVRDVKASCDGAPPGCGLRWTRITLTAIATIRRFVASRDTILFEAA